MLGKHIHFGISLWGAGSSAFGWKDSSNPVDAGINFPFYTETMLKAEAAGFTFGFVADSLYVPDGALPQQLERFEPLTILAALAAVTTRIGLIATVSTSFSEPFTVARQLASLDLLSGGRAGWNIVTTAEAGAARNYGLPLPAHDLRYEIADEFVTVAQGLWNSWDEDAFPRDRESGIFLRKESFRRLNHEGRFFKVEGPLNVSRSLQGQPVLVQAGASDAGIDLASKYADLIFTKGFLDETKILGDRIRANAAAHGRRTDSIRIFPGIDPIVAESDGAAEEKLIALRSSTPLDDALILLGRLFDHHDFSTYAPDEPFPDIGNVGDNNVRSTIGRIKARAREHGQTLREVALEFALPKPYFIGGGETVANELIRWVDSGAADGFILLPSITGDGLDNFTRFVIPALEAKGRFNRTSYRGTLRDQLGLP